MFGGGGAKVFGFFSCGWRSQLVMNMVLTYSLLGGLVNMMGRFSDARNLFHWNRISEGGNETSRAFCFLVATCIIYMSCLELHQKRIGCDDI